MECKYCGSSNTKIIQEHKDIVNGKIVWIRTYHCKNCKRNFTKSSNS